MISYFRAFDAVQTHRTFFFDKDYTPVVPKEGDWFGFYEMSIEGNQVANDLGLLRRAQYVGKEKRLIKDVGVEFWRQYDMFRDEKTGNVAPFKGLIAIKES